MDDAVFAPPEKEILLPCHQLRDGAHYLAMAWATRHMSEEASTMWENEAMHRITAAVNGLGFRLVPLTEQKEAA